MLQLLVALMPALLRALAWPALASARDRPSLAAHANWSFALGSFPLLLYLARWQPEPPLPGLLGQLQLLRAPGRAPWLQGLSDSRATTAVLTAATGGALAVTAAATPATWAHFGFLASRSWLLHAMMADLVLLALLSACLVVADARARRAPLACSAAGACLLGAAMLALPGVGPGLYLLGRPAADAGRPEARARAGTGAGWLARAAGALKRRAAAASGGAAQQVAAAAVVPLPGERRARLARAAVGTARAGAAALRSLGGGLLWLLTGGYPHLARAARTGSADETFVDFPEGGGGAAAGGQHAAPPRLFARAPALGPAAALATATQGGDDGVQLLFAPAYDEAEADEASSGGDDDDERGARFGGSSSDDGDSSSLTGSEEEDDADEGGAAAGGSAGGGATSDSAGAARASGGEPEGPDDELLGTQDLEGGPEPASGDDDEEEQAGGGGEAAAQQASDVSGDRPAKLAAIAHLHELSASRRV